MVTQVNTQILNLVNFTRLWYIIILDLGAAKAVISTRCENVDSGLSAAYLIYGPVWPIFARLRRVVPAQAGGIGPCLEGDMKRHILRPIILLAEWELLNGGPGDASVDGVLQQDWVSAIYRGAATPQLDEELNNSAIVNGRTHNMGWNIMVFGLI